MIKLLIRSIYNSILSNFAKSTNSFVKPRFINFITTYKCNSRCITCNIWDTYRQQKYKAEEELTLNDIKSYFLNNRKYFDKLISIGLSGGECTLRNDLVELVCFFRNEFAHLKFGFQTNGLYPEKVKFLLKEILALDPNFNIAVSLDGPEAIHDQIRGIKGAFGKSLETIRVAKEAGVKRITSGMTINQLNFAYIPEVFKLCQREGTEFSCFFAETGGYFNNLGLSYKLTDTQIQTVINSLLRFKDNYYMDNLRLQLEKKRGIKLTCYSGYTSLVIDPYGNIKPCILKDLPFGNIRKDQDFKKMMLSQKSKAIREELKNCRCWCQCEASSSAYINPLDVLWWFLWYCEDRKGFLRKTANRWA